MEPPRTKLFWVPPSPGLGYRSMGSWTGFCLQQHSYSIAVRNRTCKKTIYLHFFLLLQTAKSYLTAIFILFCFNFIINHVSLSKFIANWTLWSGFLFLSTEMHFYVFHFFPSYLWKMWHRALQTTQWGGPWQGKRLSTGFMSIFLLTAPYNVLRSYNTALFTVII